MKAIIGNTFTFNYSGYVADYKDRNGMSLIPMRISERSPSWTDLFRVRFEDGFEGYVYGNELSDPGVLNS